MHRSSTAHLLRLLGPSACQLAPQQSSSMAPKYESPMRPGAIGAPGRRRCSTLWLHRPVRPSAGCSGLHGPRATLPHRLRGQHPGHEHAGGRTHSPWRQALSSQPLLQSTLAVSLLRRHVPCLRRQLRGAAALADQLHACHHLLQQLWRCADTQCVSAPVLDPHTPLSAQPCRPAGSEAGIEGEQRRAAGAGPGAALHHAGGRAVQRQDAPGVHSCLRAGPALQHRPWGAAPAGPGVPPV